MKTPTTLALFTMLALGLYGCGSDDGKASSEGLEERFALIARDMIHRKDQVEPEDLADWIIEERKDFVLYDVRSQGDFATAAIQGAENLPLTYLVEPKTIAKLPADKLIVLYSNGTDHAAQAAVMLRLAGLDAYALTGGYNHWQRRILDPDLEARDDETLRVAEKRRAVACYFAGNYRHGAGDSADAPPVPAFTPALTPAPVDAAPFGQAKPPAAEGC